MSISKPYVSALLSCLLAAACAPAELDDEHDAEGAESTQADEPEETGDAAAALYNSPGNNVRFMGASDWAWHSTVSVSTNVPGMGDVQCTGTIIGPRHVITAASCMPSTSSKIGFFWNGLPDDAFTPRAGVVRVFERAGVNATTNWQDSGHVSWNIAVLELDRNVPWQVPAWLNSRDPAYGSWTYQAGLGAHNGDPATFGILAEHATTVRQSGSNYNLSWLLTDDPASPEGLAGTRGGDTGGPLYAWGPAWGVHAPGSLAGSGGLPPGQAMMLLGVYSGTNPWDAFGNRAGYTLISRRNHEFIMTAMGMKVNDHIGRLRTGEEIASFDASGWDAIACTDMCAKRPECVASNMFEETAARRWTCSLLRTVTGTQAYFGSTSSSKTSAPCVRDAAGICRL
ncbi:hypothetical protein BE08_29190 [Sorangium cellulosum]|uniref:Peptidase S1 domain-containing protein n=1 Tax=Sorangium cellulosum TaxID=56 RepID=A0A150PEH6_SORCE|nr:hypothetical protein BE08_29190 [Sorangium cellulosum]